MNAQTIIAIVLAIVTGVIANLMTPYFKRFPVFFFSSYKRRRKAMLEGELSAVREFHANPTNFYLYLLHVILVVLMLIIFVALMSIFVVIAPKYSVALLILPAALVVAMVRIYQTFQLIDAVRFFDEYESKTHEKLKALHEEIKKDAAA